MIAGRTIAKVRWMTQAEMEELGWHRRTTVLELDNGDCVYASQDDEGNGPGTLFGNAAQGENYYVFPPQEA